MSSPFENLFVHAAYQCPDWFLAPYVIGAGRWLKKRILDYDFARTLLETARPNLSDRLSAAYAYAYFQSTFDAEIRVKSMARATLHDCRFLTMEDAEAFFRPAYSPKIVAKFTKHLATSLYELLCKRDDDCGSTWQVYQLCLRVFADEYDSRKSL